MEADRNLSWYDSGLKQLADAIGRTRCVGWLVGITAQSTFTATP